MRAVAPPSSAARLVLGCAQMFGALLGLLLLATCGPSPAVVGVVLGTTGLTLLSRSLFGAHRRRR